MRIRFTKMQALRNDFVVVDGRAVPVADPSLLARTLCDRKEGVGADTLLLLLHSEGADLLVRIFNPDGSEGEMSGNGTRSAAGWYLKRAEGGGERASIETVAGVSRHHLEKKEGRRITVCSQILSPRFAPEQVPVLYEGDGDAIDMELALSTGTALVSCVSIGNPQAVVLEGWDESNWRRIGEEIERHPIFPERTNVDFGRVRTPELIEVKLWERGVGPVEASGTGASGVFAVARRKGLVHRAVRVVMDGGALDLEEAEDALILKGWCEEVFEGTIDVDRAGRRES